MNLNLPNILTWMRIILIPVFVIAYYLPIGVAHQLAACIFLTCAVTDFLDGWLARRWGQTTQFGAFLDPVADKLAVATALVILLQNDPTLWVVFPVAVIIGREITISALREWMAELGLRANVAVSILGKLKTVAQMTALVMMMWGSDILGLPTYQIGLVLLYVAAVLTLWSMVRYLRAALHVLPEAS